jgi:hypothetical protein
LPGWSALGAHWRNNARDLRLGLWIRRIVTWLTDFRDAFFIADFTSIFETTLAKSVCTVETDIVSVVYVVVLTYLFTIYYTPILNYSGLNIFVHV